MQRHFDYGTFTPSGRTFQIGSSISLLRTSPSHYPGLMTGLGSSPFVRHYLGNRFYFLFLWLLRCFSSPRSPPDKSGCQDSILTGCPIRKSPGLSSLTAHRGLSQFATSFFAIWRLGIHHILFSLSPICILCVLLSLSPRSHSI